MSLYFAGTRVFSASPAQAVTDGREGRDGGRVKKGLWSATRTAADDSVNSLIAAVGRSLTALTTVLSDINSGRESQFLYVVS